MAIIAPLLNEIAALPALVSQLQQYRASEVIIVDGGSNDGSWSWLLQNCPNGFVCLQSEPGRAQQMNAGAKAASAETLLFLHADTQLPQLALQQTLHGQWGRFDVEFSDNVEPRLRSLELVARMINLRSRVTGVATGDQAIFVKKELFESVGGFDAIPLMEDIALSKKLKQKSRPYCSRLKVRTSARRWRQNGVAKTIVLMWALRLGYFLGVSPIKLHKAYRQVR